MPIRIARAMARGWVLAVLVIAAPRGFGQQPDAQTVADRLRKVAVPAWQEYGRRLDLVQGDAVTEATVTIKDKQTTNTTRLSRKVGGGGRYALVVEQVETADGTQSQVFAVNSRYAFALTLARPGAEGQWVLSRLSTTEDATRTEILRKLEQRLLTFRAPVVARDRPLEAMIREPDFSAGADPDWPGAAAVRFAFAREPKLSDGPNYRVVRAGGLRFLPDSYWVLTDADLIVKTQVASGTYRTHVDYGAPTDGISLPTRWVEEESLKLNDGGSFATRRSTTFSLRPEASEPPEAEFTLTAFGLPEPVGVTWERPTPVYVWILAAAGGLGVLAWLFRWLARRRRQAPGVT